MHSSHAGKFLGFVSLSAQWQCSLKRVFVFCTNGLGVVLTCQVLDQDEAEVPVGFYVQEYCAVHLVKIYEFLV